MTRRQTLFRRSRASTTWTQSGGLLLESSFVLVVTALLTMGAFEVHTATRKRQETSDVTSMLHSVDAQLRAFVLREKRLPCPSDALGAELRGPSGCVNMVGRVPFATLGMEVPSLPQGRVLRYGISSAFFKESGTLLERAEKASRVALTLSQPYVAAPDETQLLVNCGAALQNPAYVLMWMPAPGQATLPATSNCFRESEDQTMGVLPVGSLEFLGWLHAVAVR